MKKNFRLILLAVMVVLMVGLLAIAVSAVDPEPADTDFYQVTDADGAHVGYYETLADAKAAITADGYTVKVLKDASESATYAADLANTYTIDGNGKTITYASGVNCFNFTKGTVTVKSLTVKATGTPLYVVAINGVCDATLENVVLDGGACQVRMYAAGNLTFKGENTKAGVNHTDWVMWCHNGSKGGVLTIDDGTFTSSANFGVMGCSGADIVINGGTFTASKLAVILMGDRDWVSPVVVNGGTLTAKSGANVICYEGNGNMRDDAEQAVLITGGTLKVMGPADLIRFAVADSRISKGASIVITGGTFDSTENENKDLINLEKNGKLEISGGVFAGGDGTVSLVKVAAAGVLEIYGGDFSGSQAWVRTQSGGMITIGETETTKPTFQGPAIGGRAFWCHNGSGMAGGQFTIAGGEFTITNGVRLFNAAGATLYVTGGKFTFNGEGIALSDQDYVSKVYISGGNFVNVGSCGTVEYDCGGRTDTAGGLVEISGGTFSSTKKGTIIDYETPKLDASLKISGGTFSSDEVRVIYMKGTYGNLEISGGEFSTKAARLIYVDKAAAATKTGHLVVTGGTFTLDDIEIPDATDNIIYVFAREKTYVDLLGGTFIDNRNGHSQTILSWAPKASIVVSGALFRAKYQQPYFFNDTEHPERSMTLNAALTDEDGYYIAYTLVGNANAPAMAGATIYAEVADPGLMYTSTISKSSIDALTATIDEGTTLSYGTLVFPLSYIDQVMASDDYLGNLKAAASAAQLAESKVYTNIVASNGITTDEAGNVTFRAALVKISAAADSYMAVSYVKATVGGNEVYYYSNLNTGNNGVNLITVSTTALADVAKAADATHKYESISGSGFSAYAKAQQNMMKAYIPA